MAWMACRSCSAKFAVGLLRCPQCGAVSELFAVPEEVVEAEQEAEMPKISVHGGPSSALGAADEPAVDTAPVVAEPESGVPQEEAVETDEEEPSAESAEPETPADSADEDAAPATPKKRAAKKTVAPPKP